MRRAPPPSDSLHALGAIPDSQVYVAVRVAVATAIIVAASPHVTRPLRYWGRIVVLLGAVSAVAFSAAWPIGALAGILVGVGAASVTHLLLGSPQGLLTAEQVDIGLADLGLDADAVVEAEDQLPGEALWLAHLSDGRDVRVKVYGRDAWDSQFVGSVWASLTRRGEMPSLGRGREALVEHEALVTLLAQQAGVSVAPLIRAGRSDQGDAIIATEAHRVSLRAIDAVDLDDDLLDQSWRALSALHGAGMSHGRIDSRHMVVRKDGSAALADFADGTVNASLGDQMVDGSRLLVTLALKVGHDRALASAQRVMGDDGLFDLLPYLQPAALGRVTRQELRRGRVDPEGPALGSSGQAGVADAAAPADPPRDPEVRRHRRDHRPDGVHADERLLGGRLPERRRRARVGERLHPARRPARVPVHPDRLLVLHHRLDAQESSRTCRS